MMGRKKRIFSCFGAIAIFLVLLGTAGYLKSVSDYKQTVSNITFQDIDITKISNGTYFGECDVDFVYAKVAVTVYEGEITEIQILEHKNERGKKAESVTSEIIEQQNIDVDAVSGATNSSKVLKKAVEGALMDEYKKGQLKTSKIL